MDKRMKNKSHDGKLQQIEDRYYYSLDLNYYLNNLEDDAYET